MTRITTSGVPEYLKPDGVPHTRLTVVDGEGEQHGSVRFYDTLDMEPGSTSDLWLIERAAGKPFWLKVKHPTKPVKTLRARWLEGDEVRQWFTDEEITPTGKLTEFLP